MLELADEDPTIRRMCVGEIERLEHLFDDLELKSLLNGPTISRRRCEH